MTAAVHEADRQAGAGRGARQGQRGGARRKAQGARRESHGALCALREWKRSLGVVGYAQATLTLQRMRGHWQPRYHTTGAGAGISATRTGGGEEGGRGCCPKVYLPRCGCCRSKRPRGCRRNRTARTARPGPRPCSLPVVAVAVPVAVALRSGSAVHVARATMGDPAFKALFGARSQTMIRCVEIWI